jgi:hypothetical protein
MLSIFTAVTSRVYFTVNETDVSVKGSSGLATLKLQSSCEWRRAIVWNLLLCLKANNVDQWGLARDCHF